MSRTYAKVKVSIWGDADFRGLSDAAQSLYFRILTSPTLSLCGVADWRPNRLSALTCGMSARAILEAAAELEDALYIVTDEETEEVLIRTFIKHDGVLKTPNVAAAMVKDYAATASAPIRGVIVHELQRLADDEPEHKGWGAAREVLSNPSVNPIGKVSVKVSVNPSVEVSVRDYPMESVNASVEVSHIPQPSTTAISPQPIEDASQAKRAQRLPDGWVPSPEDVAKIRAEFPDLDTKAEHVKFADHFAANGKPMKDWHAAWRNWMRRAADFAPRRPLPNNPTSQGVDWDAAMARAAERDRLAEEAS